MLFIDSNTAKGSTLPAFWAPATHRSMMEAYSYETAVHEAGCFLLNSSKNLCGFLKLMFGASNAGSSKSGNW